MSDPISPLPAPRAVARAAARPDIHAGAEPRQTAVGLEFEAAFLAEMLKHSGLTRSLGAMAGPGGESGFSDLLIREIASDIARSRPLGIASMLDLPAGEGQ